MGLGARAMNLPITIAESNAGLVPPAVAPMLLGAGGALLLVFQVRRTRGGGDGAPRVAGVKQWSDLASEGCARWRGSRPVNRDTSQREAEPRRRFPSPRPRPAAVDGGDGLRIRRADRRVLPHRL